MRDAGTKGPPRWRRERRRHDGRAVAGADGAGPRRDGGRRPGRGHTPQRSGGPLFGIATQDQDGGWRWRLAVTHGCPQQARDALNSLLWLQAKDQGPRTPHSRLESGRRCQQPPGRRSTPPGPGRTPGPHAGVSEQLRADR
ncbi:DUF5954 family protein [Streptomyces sp. NPDC046685]|uniref:DUF5954 family protein n=1 Tax=Streptomyces sp. NPDC046685 TaxID=3157202 RepID=UPI003400D7E3